MAESDDFPEEFFKVKVLPELLKSVEFGGGGPKVFALVMRISKKLSDEEYDSQITPVIVRLFSSPDRALRVCLLDNLPLMIDHLSPKTVNDKIFPQMVSLLLVTSDAILTLAPGDWLQRSGSYCTRADCQSCSGRYRKTLGSNRQWRAA